ncbi:MAG: hypothetical protein HC836_35680 [Richelia sp. RM2_1_2]|nr:hypothetical protein [Richelia sp. RM1_1_1]NJO63367.1 hypothetical protein [Richelia sp. RM2_1_2]
MTDIETDVYWNLLKSTTKITKRTVSTIDHVFASPPVRLVDGHSKLTEIDANILIADITVPSIKSYRQDMILDTGFLSTLNKDYYLFEEGVLSAVSNLQKPDFKMLKQELGLLLKHIQLPNNKIACIKTRLDNLIYIYQSNLDKSQNTSDFYKAILEDLYRLIGLEELANFIHSNALSYFNSGFIDNYLPNLIKQTKDKAYSLENLASDNIFDKPLFRDLDGNATCINSLDYISKLRDKKIIPSHQVVSWGLALAGVKHFGNDYGFYTRLGNYLVAKGVENNIAQLQLTEHKQDGTTFVGFNNSLCFAIERRIEEIKFQPVNKKLSRLNTITSLYLHLGQNGMSSYWQQFKTQNKTTLIPMGEIL